MAQDENGYVHEFSVFGGRPLAEDLPGIAQLAELGISDAEQVAALAALPEVRPHLEELLGSDTLAMLTERVAAAVPAMALDAFSSGPVGGLFGLGSLEPSAEVEAEIESAAAAASFAGPVALPPSVNYANAMPPVRQQGRRGTCVAFALTAVHEYWRIASKVPVDLSEQFLYHRTKMIDGSPNVCGTWQVKAAQVLSRIGECREVVWPYNPDLPCNNNGVQPGNAMADAAHYKISPIVLQPKDVNAIKTALAGGSCVGFSIPVYNSWYQNAYTRQTGRINMRVGGEPSAGGHAMCLVGYQDDPRQPGGGLFILRNSWGNIWGVQCPYGVGNGTIPYAYIANDCWEAVTVPAPRHLQPHGPFTPGEGDGTGSGRPTITIDTQGQFDIVIK